MIKKYKNISIFKREASDDPKKPTHDIVVSVEGDYNDKAQAGSMWTKDGQKGKFLSGQFSKMREFQGKVYSGFVLVDEAELDKLLQDLDIKTRKPDYPLSDSNVDSLDPSSIDF